MMHNTLDPLAEVAAGIQAELDKDTQPAGLRDVLKSVAHTAAGSDLDRYRAHGQRLLETAQAKLVKAEHDLTTGRARIVADGQARLAELMADTREKLRRFDNANRETVQRLHEELETLVNMREAGEP
jgi:hypothetical protein